MFHLLLCLLFAHHAASLQVDVRDDGGKREQVDPWGSIKSTFNSMMPDFSNVPQQSLATNIGHHAGYHGANIGLSNAASHSKPWGGAGLDQLWGSNDDASTRPEANTVFKSGSAGRRAGDALDFGNVAATIAMKEGLNRNAGMDTKFGQTFSEYGRDPAKWDGINTALTKDRDYHDKARVPMGMNMPTMKWGLRDAGQGLSNVADSVHTKLTTPMTPYQSKAFDNHMMFMG